MEIKDLLGLVIFIILIIWVIYNLIYWNVLSGRYPDKANQWAVDNTKLLPYWFPFKSKIVKNAERRYIKRSIWPGRLINLFIIIMILSFF